MQSTTSLSATIMSVDRYPNSATLRILHRVTRAVLPSAFCAFAFLCAASTPLAAQAAYFTGVVSTLLNTGNPNAAAGLAIDQQGNLFYADYGGDHEVYEVPLTSSGYGTPIAIATFNDPVGVAVDSSDDLFVADFGAGNVYELVYSAGSWGTPSQIGGSSFVSPTGVKLDASGNLFVADYATSGTSMVYELINSGGSYGAATALGTTPGLSFVHAADVALDGAGNVFVADDFGNEVYEITKSSGYTTELTVGTGFPLPSSLVFDRSGNLYIIDDSPFFVEEVLAVSGSIPTSNPTVLILGEGEFTNANGAAIDNSGRLFVSDPGSFTVKELLPSSANFGAVNVGAASPPSLDLPFVFTTTETLNPNVVLTQGATGLDFSQTATTCSGTVSAFTICTVTVQFAPAAPGLRTGAVQLEDSSGNVLATANIFGTGIGPQVVFPSNSDPSIVGSGFSSPAGAAVDGSGDVFIADSGNSAVKEIVAVAGHVSSGSVVNTVGSGFSNPGGVALDGSGDIFVADKGNNEVKEIVAIGGQVSATSTVNTVGSGFNGPDGVAVDGSGDVFVADKGNNEVKEILAVNGQVCSNSTVVTVGSGFSGPSAVVVDGSGDVFVADSGNNAVKEIVAVDGQVSSNSTVNTVGSGLTGPTGLALDAAGDVFVADQGNNAVKEIVAVGGQVSSGSTVVTLGWGFVSPAGVALDAGGDVFVADLNFANESNSGVTEMPLASPPSLAFSAITEQGTTDNTDGPLSATIANNGNATLTFNLPSTGDNPSLSTANFAWDDPSSTCTQTTPSSSTAFTLAEGASCSAAVDFTPTLSGTLTDNLSVTDNTLNSTSATQQIALSGTAAISAKMTTPTPSGTLTGASTTFTWSAGSGGVTGYYLWVGTSPGAADLANIGPLSGTTATVNLPTNGATIYVQLYTNFSGGGQMSNTYNYTEYTVSAAAITSPTNGSTLTGASTTFTWSAGAGGVTGYYLHIGTTSGGSNLVNIGPLVGTSATVDLPTDGATIYVQLQTSFSGGSSMLSSINNYTEFTVSAAAITSPTNSSTLTGASTTFNWSAGAGGVTGYYLWVGTSPGTANLVNIGPLSGTSATVNLPTDGATIYVQLYTNFSGGSQLSNSYTYTEYTVSAATITSPTNGSTLNGASTTFNWSAGAGGVTGYYLHIGTSSGGSNLANIGPLVGTSATVNLPTDGATIFVQLYTNFSGGSQLSNSYTYTEYTVTAAAITSPTNSGTLTGASTTFNWSAGSGGVTGYYLWVGTSPGTANLVNIGPLSGTSATVNLPTDGATIYVQLYTNFSGGSQLSNSYTYTEYTVTAAAITSPTNGSTLTGASTTFNWSAGAGGVTGYYLWVGTSPGGTDLVNIGPLSSSSTSATVTLPTNGAPIYVQLWTAYSGDSLMSSAINNYTEFTQ